MGQKWPVFKLFSFLGSLGQAFLPFKNKKSKRASNWHFSKGVNSSYGFCPKLAIFPIFFFRHYRPEKCFLRNYRTKIAFLSYKNKKFKRSKNSHFFKVVTPWFWSKNGHFSNFFFVGNIGQENVVYDILERKKAFLRYKNKKFKSRKIDIFAKGLNHCFGPKMSIFPTFFF